MTPPGPHRFGGAGGGDAAFALDQPLPVTEERPTDSLPIDGVPAVDETLDLLVVMQAFRSLSVRWQRALWMVNVAHQVTNGG